MTDTDQTTTIPCPPWCDLAPGHGIELDDPSDSTWGSRFHRRTVADVSTERGENAACVDLECLETSRGERIVVTTPVVLSIFGYREGDALDGPQARQLAAALLNAADEWNKITGATT